MSISNEEKELDDDFIICVAIILIIIIRSRQLLQNEYDDDDLASEDGDCEDVEEEEEEVELASEVAHCEDLEDGVEVTSCRKRSNLALKDRDIAGSDHIDKVIEGFSSDQKRGRCTSPSESDCSASKKPPTGGLVKEKLKGAQPVSQS